MRLVVTLSRCGRDQTLSSSTLRDSELLLFSHKSLKIPLHKQTGQRLATGDRMGYASYCNSSRSVECPQCQTKYRFVFPKLPTHVKLLIMANQLCDSGVTALVISGLFYSANLGRRRRHRFTLSKGRFFDKVNSDPGFAIA